MIFHYKRNVFLQKMSNGGFYWHYDVNKLLKSAHTMIDPEIWFQFCLFIIKTRKIEAVSQDFDWRKNDFLLRNESYTP